MFKKKLKKSKTTDVRPYVKGSFLRNIKPKTGYVFHSDYFEVEGNVGTVLSVFNSEGSDIPLPPMWGISMLNVELPQTVKMILLEQANRWEDNWVTKHLNISEDNLEISSQTDKTTTDVQKKATMRSDIEVIADEIRNGDSYLNVHFRILLYAPDLDTLDEAVEMLERGFKDSFKTVSVAPYHGEQYNEINRLFINHESKRNKGFGFTSTELAGQYNLVTAGLSDDEGEYVGQMVADVNTSAILFDVDGYLDKVVVAHEEQISTTERMSISHAWGEKIMQSALINRHRVAEMVLAPIDLESLGHQFPDRTVHIDLQRGEINMFEPFGDASDPQDLFNQTRLKIELMVGRYYNLKPEDVSVVNGILDELLTNFYIDRGMWVRNASRNAEAVRMKDLVHNQVPVLHDFQLYVDQKANEILNSSKAEFKQKSSEIIKNTFRSMLQFQGKLFDHHTTNRVDDIQDTQRVVYDLSNLYQVDPVSAMAQFINAVTFASSKLEAGDVLMIHSCDIIEDKDVQAYLQGLFTRLNRKQVRIVLLYDKTDNMIHQQELNEFHKADYTILGPMSERTLDLYKQTVHGTVPPDLGSALTTHSGISYIRRNMANVVFEHDIRL